MSRSHHNDQAKGQATRGRESNQALSSSGHALWRALAHPKLSKAAKRRLREIYRTLDPVALLAEMRAAQAQLGTRVDARAGKLAAAASLPAPTTNAAAFAKRLGNDVHLGEQRIIHRRMHKPYKKRKVTSSDEAIRGALLHWPSRNR